ncbi:MAG TPA: FAD-binding oxidoreductase [Acidimicrobiales bacterium]|nr:FAD-binding oxidoreductase [Acidimicrobiales bacterium]
MNELLPQLTDVVGPANITTGDSISPDDTHDEALGMDPVMPLAVVRPSSTAEVAAVLAAADVHGTPVTARGKGTGMSGACRPRTDGIVVSFDRMNRILEIDTANHTATVQAGVTLAELDEATAAEGLVYEVFPGENSASLGGNVATNAGGMRAVKYGVTRHNVLGIEAVLANGESIRSGGKYVKSSSGYDLTQLVIGSEGTLALVTEATLQLRPRLEHVATVLAPFATLDEVTRAVPRIVGAGLDPMMLEYIDFLTMAGATAYVGLELGLPDDITENALAYLMVVLESADATRLEEDVAACATLLGGLGAMDVFVLPSAAGAKLVEAREKAFWLAKASNADEIIDTVVPRASIPDFLTGVSEVAAETGTLIAGCGHAGDGNVHLAIFQPDTEVRDDVLHRVFALGMDLGGAISGEHGLGKQKAHHYIALEDPAKLALMRRIKAAFDPHAILNPGTIYD